MAPAASTARHHHLVRAAQSAGEAFGCHLGDETAGGRSRRLGDVSPLVWASLAVLVAALYLVL